MKHILLLEDDREISLMLRIALERAVHYVTLAGRVGSISATQPPPCVPHRMSAEEPLELNEGALILHRLDQLLSIRRLVRDEQVRILIDQLIAEAEEKLKRIGGRHPRRATYLSRRGNVSLAV